MIRYVIVSAMFLTTGLLIYNLGQKQCRTEMLTARQELKENVQVEKSRIYARPNAGRSALLKLMRSGTLCTGMQLPGLPGCRTGSRP